MAPSLEELPPEYPPTLFSIAPNSFFQCEGKITGALILLVAEGPETHQEDVKGSVKSVPFKISVSQEVSRIQMFVLWHGAKTDWKVPYSICLSHMCD